MKKGKRRVIIWIIGIIVAILLVNMATMIFVRFIYSADTDFTKYANKAENLLYPEELDDQEKVPAVLNLRSLLSDHRLNGYSGIVGVASCTGTIIDYSVKYDSREGESLLREGKWIPVVKPDNDINLLKDTIGVVSANQICESEYADRLYEILAGNRNATIIINKYVNDNYIITPIDMTILDSIGNELATFAIDDMSYDADKIIISEAKIYNEYQPDELFSNADYCLYDSMTMSMMGNRKVDAITESMVESADYNNKESYNKIKYGIGRFTIEQFAISDDNNYLMAYAVEYNYYNSFMFYSIILITFWSIVVLLSVLLIKRKKEKNYLR